jgi:glutamate-5-semialdehyde dehydrogenase
MGEQARAASAILTRHSTAEKAAALRAAAAAIRRHAPAILAANAKDLEAGKARGLTSALLDRHHL